MRPEIKAETIKKKRATLETKIEKTRYIPDISIQANYLTAPNISFLRAERPVGLAAVDMATWIGDRCVNIAQKVDAEKRRTFQSIT